MSYEAFITKNNEGVLFNDFDRRRALMLEDLRLLLNKLLIFPCRISVSMRKLLNIYRYTEIKLSEHIISSYLWRTLPAWIGPSFLHSTPRLHAHSEKRHQKISCVIPRRLLLK
jgi:hypothetical protein